MFGVVQGRLHGLMGWFGSDAFLTDGGKPAKIGMVGSCTYELIKAIGWKKPGLGPNFRPAHANPFPPWVARLFFVTTTAKTYWTPSLAIFVIRDSDIVADESHLISL